MPRHINKLVLDHGGGWERRGKWRGGVGESKLESERKVKCG